MGARAIARPKKASMPREVTLAAVPEVDVVSGLSLDKVRLLHVNRTSIRRPYVTQVHSWKADTK